jgi:hypothetical protein
MGWWRRRATHDDKLREFVYLDEVSVYSLLASRSDGFIELDKTLSESVSKRRGLSARIGGGGKDLGAEVRSHLEDTTSSGSQVVKKSIIQTAFKQLLERESASLVISEGYQRTKLPKIASERDLSRVRDQSHVIPVSRLQRGGLLELEVELDTERLFQASRVVATLFEFFERIPELFPLDPASRSAGAQIRSLFDQLLHDLVPIEARVVNYELVKGESDRFLVSTELLESDGWRLGLNQQSVYVVGVAEEKHFWRDLRRVLFSRSRYHIMARLGRDGIQARWQPAKVVEMLDRVIPQVDDQIRLLGESFLEGVKEGADQEGVDRPRERSRKLEQFAVLLAEKNGCAWEQTDSMESGLAARSDPDPNDIEAQREASRPIVTHLESKTGKNLDPEVTSEVRAEIFLDPGMDGDLVVEQEHDRRDPELALLDCEIVAIYW